MVQDPPIISQREAADQGKLKFFTGKPCKYGHVCERYVTTGGCINCLTSRRFRPRRNAFSAELVPFHNDNLWTWRGFSREQRIVLRVYLQQCIFEFIRTQTVNEPMTVRANLEAAMAEIQERSAYAATNPNSTD